MQFSSLCIKSRKDLHENDSIFKCSTYILKECNFITLKKVSKGTYVKMIAYLSVMKTIAYLSAQPVY